MSASLYLTLIEKNPKKFITFWNDERELLLERDAQGFRAIDAGPLTMGYRTSNSRTGFRSEEESEKVHHLLERRTRTPAGARCAGFPGHRRWTADHGLPHQQLSHRIRHDSPANLS